MIQELGRDIGPKPRAVKALDGDDDDEIDLVDDDMSFMYTPEERVPRHGKGRQSQDEDAHEDIPSGTDRWGVTVITRRLLIPLHSSPVSALFSAGNLSRRNKTKSYAVETNGFASGSSSLTGHSTVYDSSRTEGSRYASGSKTTHLE